MPMSSKLDLLAKLPLFSACTPKELREIARLATKISALEGEVLAKEGGLGREFFVIADGKARVILKGDEIAVLGPGDFFGEMALLDQGPRAASVVAASPMVLYVIDARGFGDLIERVPFVARRILRGLSERLRAAEGAPTYIWNR
ncbi:MAG: cyclic nucleotide-binding domain-containing protein [Actinomycetota bacterium]